MQYVLIALALIVGGLGYVRFEQPQMWNQYLTALKAPEVSAASSAGPNSDTAPSPDSVVVRTPPKAPEIISPTSNTYTNPDHVRSVDQPGEAPSTNAAAASP
jgi:hypothetical protein